jgi:tetratricopeptide (TPR) repeat protein
MTLKLSLSYKYREGKMPLFGKIGPAIICLALLAMASPAASGSLDDINAGNQAARNGKLTLAIKLYSQAISAGGLSAENLAIAYNNRGSAKDDLGRADEAVRDFNQAVKANPGYAEAYYNRSFAFERKGLIKMALADIRRAAELSPGDPDYQQRLAYLEYKSVKKKAE